MRAVLKLELIADNLYQYQRIIRQNPKLKREMSLRQEMDLMRFSHKSLKPWVARITGITNLGFVREFVSCTKDYSDANSIGSRGVYAYYILRDGVYEVNERLNWKRARRYFIRVQREAFSEISREEVLRWLGVV